MKKRLIFFLLISIFWSLALYSQLPVNDCFESGDFLSSNWITEWNAQISTESPYEGIYCVKGPGNWKLEQIFENINCSVFIVEFAMKASQTTRNCVDMRVHDIDGYIIANVFFRHTGNIEAYDGYNNNLPLMPYSVNTWYKVKLILDVQNQLYDVYIDDVLLADDFEFYNITNKAPRSLFWRSMESSGTGWVDCINITADQVSALPVSDCFESGDFSGSNWTTEWNAQITTEDPYEGEYCVKGPSNWKLEQVFNNISDEIVVTEFAMKAAQTGSNCVDMRIYDVNDLLIANVFFRWTGYISAYDGYQGPNVCVHLMPYSDNTWYRVKMILDIPNQSYDVYIDDVLMADDFEFYNITNAPPKTFYWRSMESWGTGWVDCIDIYGETPSSISAISASPNVVCSGAEVQLTAQVSGQNFTYLWTSSPSGFTSTEASPLVYPSESTTYTLTISDDFGTDNESVFVEVNPTPVAEAGEDQTIYIGYYPDIAQLDASGGISYTWSPVDGLSDPNIPNPIASPEVSTMYTVIVTDENGCSSVDSVFIIVVDCVCGNNNNMVLMCHELGNSGNFRTVCVSQNSVPALLANGSTLGPCEKDLEVDISFNHEFKVTAYPNPFVNFIRLEITVEKTASTSIEMYNMLGQPIMNKDLGILAVGEHSITIYWASQLKQGLYYMRVLSGNEKASISLIK